MRILHVVTVIDDLATYGGQVAVALNQCAELRDRGHQVRLLAGWRTAGEQPEQIEQIPVQLFRVAATGTGPGLARAWLPMTTWLRRNADQFDIAHLHLSPQLSPALAAMLLARAGVPYVVQTHGLLAAPGRTVLTGPRRPLGRRAGLSAGSTVALRGAAGVLAADPAERQAVVELVGAADGITVLRPAVGATRPAGRGDGPVRRAAARPRALDVLLVCRLHPDKGVLAFAEAAQALVAEGVDARFTVLGPDAGGRAALVRHLSDHPELTGRLVLSGPTSRDKTLERIRRADLFVLPPGDGAHSMALLEALAAGVASICSSDYGHAIPLRAQQGVRVVRPSAQALAHAIRALAADPVARAALGARGRAAVLSAFGIGPVVDELEQVYAEALARTEQPVAIRATNRSLPQVLRAPRRTGVDRCLVWLASEVSDDRLALWREVGRLCDLTVALIAPTEADWRLLLDGGSEPFTVVPLGSRWTPGRTLHELVRNRPDAVVLDGWRSPVYRVAARLARRNGVAVVVTLADPEPAAAQPRIVRTPRAHRRLLRQADAVLTAGSAAVDAALSAGVRADRIAVRPQPAVVDLRARGERASVIDVREGHRFLYLGPLVVRRNVEALLRGFHLARAIGDLLTVCGSGPLRARLSELAAQLGIDEAVTFIAEQDAPARVVALGAAHTVVLPGGYETGARLVDEALAAGRHVVVGSSAAAAASASLFVADPTPAGLSRAMMSSRQRWATVGTGRTGTRV